MHDFRPVSARDSYTFNLRAEVAAVLLQWDVDSLPTQFSQLALRQVSPQPGQTYQMRSVGSLQLPALAGQAYTFQIELGYSQQIQLAAGWNMISLPGQPQDSDPQQLQGVLQPLYRWDPAQLPIRR